MPWAPNYLTVDQLASYVRIPDDADDAELVDVVAGASRAVDRHCRRQFGLVMAPEARTYRRARWSKNLQGWRVWVDDFQTVTGLILEIDIAGDRTYTGVVDLAYIDKLPDNAAERGRPWESLLIRYASPVKPAGHPGEVRVTARWGWTEVPDVVSVATKLQASRLLARRDAPYGIAGSPSEGSEMRLLAKVDPDVAVSLEDYRRRRWG